MTPEQYAAVLEAIDALGAAVAALHLEVGTAPPHACWPLAELPTIAEVAEAGQVARLVAVR